MLAEETSQPPSKALQLTSAAGSAFGLLLALAAERRYVSPLLIIRQAPKSSDDIGSLIEHRTYPFRSRSEAI
jgi:hypothetical protein